ncbi:MAG: CHAD domain-containing protein [Pseudomonadota bacterium]
MREIELKLQLDAASEKRVRRHSWSGAFHGSRPMTRGIHTIYFDTADHRLAHSGIALRLRKTGQSWVQTVKLGRDFRLGLSDATEHCCAAPGGRLDLGGIPDRTARDAVLANLSGSVLGPVFATRIRRTSRLVRLPGSVIEIAIDVGEIATDDATEPLRELELELIDGDPSQIFIVLKQLFPEGQLALSFCSKADRGFALAAGKSKTGVEIPRRARMVQLAPEFTIAKTIRACLLDTCGQIVSNREAALAEMLPDTLKQFRIGLRRFRSALLFFRKHVAGIRPSHLNEEARWLAEEIATVRDLDVILNDILIPERAVSNDPGFERIEKELSRRITDSQKRLEPLLKSARVQAFLIDLMSFSLTAEFDRASKLIIMGHAGNLLEKRWTKVRACAQNLEALTIEERHDLRKQLKKMRYSLEFVRTLYPNEVLRPFLKNLKRLQEIFGDLNDAAMVEDMFMGSDAPLANDLAAQRAIGRLIGSRMARAEVAWCRARVLWNEIDETAVFWR